MPPPQSDIVVMLGVLERIADVETLFTHLRFCKQDVMLSYCPTNLAEAHRAVRGFANHLELLRSGAAVRPLRLPHRMHRADRRRPDADAADADRRLLPVAACNVAVISDSDAGDFGDRLGCI